MRSTRAVLYRATCLSSLERLFVTGPCAGVTWRPQLLTAAYSHLTFNFMPLLHQAKVWGLCSQFSGQAENATKPQMSCPGSNCGTDFLACQHRYSQQTLQRNPGPTAKPLLHSTYQKGQFRTLTSCSVSGTEVLQTQDLFCQAQDDPKPFISLQS